MEPSPPRHQGQLDSDTLPRAVAALEVAEGTLDAEFVAAEEARVTRGYLRLVELTTLELSIVDYPLPEARAPGGGASPAGPSPTGAAGPGPPARR